MKMVTILTLVLLVPALSGCVAFVVGAAAGGATGYYIYHDEDHK